MNAGNAATIATYLVVARDALAAARRQLDASEAGCCPGCGRKKHNNLDDWKLDERLAKLIEAIEKVEGQVA